MDSQKKAFKTSHSNLIYLQNNNFDEVFIYIGSSGPSHLSKSRQKANLFWAIHGRKTLLQVRKMFWVYKLIEKKWLNGLKYLVTLPESKTT